MTILLGQDIETGETIHLDPDVLAKHMHLIGATGSGKTTAIHTMLQSLMLDTGEDKCCLFVIDPMGGLSRDLLRFISDERLCPGHVRRRLAYFEPSNPDFVCPFNPLKHSDESNRYYNVMRAVEIVLRAWDAQSMSEQPRLLNWTFKAFCAAAYMGFPISTCRYLLHPGSDIHDRMLEFMPEDLKHQWSEILNARGGEATRILESTRNRLDPFFNSPSLRYMFGVSENRFDCERFIRERRIVIMNLAKLQRLPGFAADTIGSLVLNEVFETAGGMSTRYGKKSVDPTYVLLDEFQKYVSPDIEDAIPTVRQNGLRLMLAHQSFAQLEQESVDLQQMIWQAQTRLMFTSNAKDADLLADEIGKMTFDKMKVKHMQRSRRQLIAGHHREWMRSVGQTSTRSHSDMSNTSQGDNESSSYGTTPGKTGSDRQTRGSGETKTRGNAETDAYSDATTESKSEQLVPIYDNFVEESPTFLSFDEHAIEWGKLIRLQNTGEAIFKQPNDSRLRRVKIDYFELDETPRTDARIEELKQRNFDSDLFISTAEAEQLHEKGLQRLLSGQIHRIETWNEETPKIEGANDADENNAFPL
ncbi:AAA-like domain protein [Rubripirellula obstinata]|uniref:AAA-like domain protein n=1 Tax=Rubripirellula obstinata TaxID=406547 RepID=A0A5B1CEE1_9BACT|nr:type IV secretion system DNA-binding domain-containing protein [Rubripirellula obstinata]KAA1258582.1 AAA-like domain protein [Rubripirellula obstinata]